MKKVLLSIFMVGIAAFASGQSGYYQFKGPDGSNPGDLNADAEYPPGGGLPAGWTTVLSGSGADKWSASQTLPFSFKFNGNPVSAYKVSSTGVLTFTTGATAVPSESNADLPSASIPDNSILCWGLNIKTSSDYIVTKTFGTAPNRQFWIQFNSATEKNIQAGWVYMSIVLEETSNNIFIVDQRFYCTTGSAACGNKTAMSLGIQIDGTTAIKVTGTPSYEAASGNSVTDASDNKYFAFYPGTQKVSNIAMSSLAVGTLVTKGANTPVAGTFLNYGSATINTFKLNYSINGGSVVTQNVTGVSIASGAKYSFSHTTPINEPTGGVFGNLVVWTSDINGNPDEVPSNDTIKQKYFVINGTPAPKKVMLEEATGAWCQHCPDAHTYIKNIEDANPDKVVIAVHHNSDGMVNTESDVVNTAYNNGYPSGYIDRQLIPGNTRVGINRGLWASEVNNALSHWSPIKVTVKNATFNGTNRKITFDVEAEFTDYYYGTPRIGAMIVEDFIRGPAGGNQYDQVISSVYTTNASHVYYGYTTPMEGYYHKHVVINIPSTAYGTANSIPGTTFNPGDKFTQTYSYTLPAQTSITLTTNAQFYPIGAGIAGRNKPIDINLLGFVANYDANVNKRDILNSNQARLWDTKSSITGISGTVAPVSAYPNPANNSTSVDFVMQAEDVTLTVTNTLGQIVKEIKITDKVAGTRNIAIDTKLFANGVYNIHVTSASMSGTTKLVVAH